jgi:hypothetical protein
MRKLSTLVLALVALLVISLGSVAVAASHRHANKHSKHTRHSKHHKQRKARKAGVPLSGIYDSCAVSSPKQHDALPDCSDRLAVLHQGGFQVVLNYGTGNMSLEDNLAYAAEAQAQGMQVIWNLGTYRDLNTGGSIPIGPKLDLVRATMNLPATWGYYIGDEHPEYLPQATELSRAVRGITNRPLLYVSRPSPSKLRPFKGLADYLGPDSYPVGPFDKPTCQTARWASRMVKSNLTMVLQAYSWSIDYPAMSPDWPNAAQMRQQRNQAIRCGRPKLLLWFCFHCVTEYNPSPDSYWRQLAWAANGANLGANYRMTSVSAG